MKSRDDLHTTDSKYSLILFKSVSLKSALLDSIQGDKNYFYKVIAMHDCTSGNTGDTAKYTGFGLAIKNLYVSNSIFIIYSSIADITGSNAKIIKLIM